MGRFGLALKILFNGHPARKFDAARSRQSPPVTQQATPEPTRSEAVTLLAAFRRDTRCVDFVQESIDGYNDAQVGAAVRDGHCGFRDVLKRMFDLRPIIDREEDGDILAPDPASARWHLIGNMGQSSRTVSGRLLHAGWKSLRCRVPEWSGSSSDTEVVSPAEVQVS
ncbi:MAG: DUF2760 domain-containing protein [Fuerstiella sp.]|nr:DUF2760 domain-containing protein [Fuerstiella sp.]